MIQLQGKSDRRYDQRWEAGKILASPFSVLAEPGLIDLGCPAQALMGFSLVSIRFIHSVTSQEIFNILSLGCRAIWLLYFEWVENGQVFCLFFVCSFFMFYFCFAFLVVVLPLLLNILCNPVHSGASSISILCAENLLDTWRCVLWVCNPSGSFSTASLQLKIHRAADGKLGWDGWQTYSIFPPDEGTAAIPGFLGRTFVWCGCSHQSSVCTEGSKPCSWSQDAGKCREVQSDPWPTPKAVSASSIQCWWGLILSVLFKFSPGSLPLLSPVLFQQLTPLQSEALMGKNIFALILSRGSCLEGCVCC